ncbi:DUF2247 family protein [Myxococcus vastator]|uniref:DUF2247 family protein n=1 Tax=Myxococcus vastator TaxID=2709664 RepID=UPI001F080DEF|nr:DUF2247 family protein [Myxococcus vastator]
MSGISLSRRESQVDFVAGNAESERKVRAPMDLVKLGIPYGFLRERTRLTWREVLFGMDNELLSSEVPVEKAVEQLGIEDGPARALVDLAGLEPWRSPRDYVGALADAEARQDAEAIKGKWLYLVLDWVFINREHFADPLEMVEKIYADFGYPERIARFIRYMPSDEPDLGSRELNEQRLYGQWKNCLDELSVEYSPRGAGT